MGKILKLGFAMGGGVSLGAFSGSALSEAIKLAILYGGYNDSTGWHKYDNVVVDVFSGASAGSISLAIMLRVMSDPLSNCFKCCQKDVEYDNTTLSFNNWNNYNSNEKGILTAHLVQEVQNQIWVNEINVDKLLPKEKELTYEGGLFDRKALEDIASNYFDLKNKNNPYNFKDKQILADRVLFASTLSNLSPLTYSSLDSKDLIDDTLQSKINTQFPLIDALTSQNHKELRVFDIFFNEKKGDEIFIDNDPTKGINPKYPAHWVRCHSGDKVDDIAFDIRKKSTWSKIVSTSIACGAFPFAFEPVVLERYKYEYEKGLWPKELEGNKHNFSYIDGGLFNNEPVREAFRLAAHLDAMDEPDNFDRIVIFVDPNVSENPTDLRVPIFQEYSVNDDQKAIKNSTLDKFAHHIPNMLGIIMDQAKIDENDKIFQTVKLFDKRDDYYKRIESLIDITSNDDNKLDAVFSNLKTFLEILIDGQRPIEILPPGSITYKNEIKRIIYLDKKTFNDILEDNLDGFSALNISKKLLFIKASYRIFIDQMINLTGKSPDKKWIGISPLKFVNDIPKPRVLPGSELEAFGGFFSTLPREYAVGHAKECTKFFMNKAASKLFENDIKVDFIDWNQNQQKQYTDEFMSKLHLVNDRLDNIIHKTDLLPLHLVTAYFISHKVKKILKTKSFDAETQKYLFKIKVANKHFEIKGISKEHDIETIQINNEYFLIAELEFNSNNNSWTGEHVQNNTIKIDHPLIFNSIDRPFCSIELPDINKIKEANLQINPVFELIHNNGQGILETDRGGSITRDEWRVTSEVKPLEETLTA